MWKKMTFSRPREPVIGSPKLIGTTLNQDTLRAMPRIPGTLHDNATNKSLKSLPPLPLEEEDPDSWTPYPDHPAYKNYDSEGMDEDVAGLNSRQQSSYYSIRYSSGYSEANGTPEISPPDSPAPGAANHKRQDSDVSSLEEEVKKPVRSPQKTARFSSQLPVPRKTTRPAPEKTKSEIYPAGPVAREIGKPEQAPPAMHHHSFFGRNKDPNKATRQKDQKPSAADRQTSDDFAFTPRTVTTITSGGSPNKLRKPLVPTKVDKKKLAVLESSQASPSSSRLPIRPPELPELPVQSHNTHFSEGLPSQAKAGNNASPKPPMKTDGDFARLFMNNSAQVRPVSEMPPVMERRRPLASSAASIKSVTRKPTPFEFQAEKYKSLPLAPAEIKYQSRVDMLEAKREELRCRRININSIIDELTQVVPTSRAYDLAARNEIKKTVASLNDELAEINREDHELGLKILRAWKKRDEECVYESGSSLWVKRVTG